MSQALKILKREPPMEKITAVHFRTYGDLPQKASEILGYDVFQKEKENCELRRIFDELELRPFTLESVKQYKQQMLKEANTRIFWLHFSLRIISNISLALCVFCLGPAILGWFISWKVGLFFVVSYIVSLVIFGSLNGFVIKGPGSWKVNSLNDYTKPVPRFVLSSAVEIKKRLPMVELFVHEFIQHEEVLCPFLVVCHDDKEYFIAVWDEANFEASQKI